jgi:glutamine amidotransferase
MRHRSVEPIWTEIPRELPESRLVIVHARSAFRNEGIVVENNMPFLADDLSFAFNGELRGVRLSVPGETGAARLLELLRRFRSSEGGGLGPALERLDRVVTSRTEYVRALNTVVSDGQAIWLGSRYSEDPEYFTLWHASLPELAGGTAVACSERIETPESTPSWQAIPNGATVELDLEKPCWS